MEVANSKLNSEYVKLIFFLQCTLLHLSRLNFITYSPRVKRSPWNSRQSVLDLTTLNNLSSANVAASLFNPFSKSLMNMLKSAWSHYRSLRFPVVYLSSLCKLTIYAYLLFPIIRALARPRKDASINATTT